VSISPGKERAGAYMYIMTKRGNRALKVENKRREIASLLLFFSC